MSARRVPAEPCAMACLVEAGRDGRLGEREEASLTRHLAACATCRTLARELDEVRALLRRPSSAPPTPLQHHRGRVALLRAAVEPASRPRRSPVTPGGPPGAPRRRAAMGGAIGVAMASVAALAFAWPQPAAVPVAQRLAVTVNEARGKVRDPPTVAPLAAVREQEPPREVMPVLADVAPAPTPAEPRPPRRPPVALGDTPRPRARPEADDEASRSFGDAVGLLGRGDYAAANAQLTAFRAAHPADGRADLAAFLTIVSLQRAGRRAEAQDAARRYLELYPEGDRRTDASRVASGR